MKGQLISDWKRTRYVWRQWIKGPIQVSTTGRFYGRLSRTEGTFVSVELD